MVRENPTASLASLASGQSFALTGGTVILEDGSQSASDIIVGADGRIVAVEPFLDTSSCGACVDIAGMLVTPGFLDAHQHLDKTGVLRFTPNPSGTLQGAREAFAKDARTAGPDDIHKRARLTLER
jgi:cytosine deaminase